MPQDGTPQNVSSQLINARCPPAGLTNACQPCFDLCLRCEIAKLMLLPSLWKKKSCDEEFCWWLNTGILLINALKGIFMSKENCFASQFTKSFFS